MKQIRSILFLTPWYPNRYDAMIGLFIRRQALALSKDLPVTVLSVVSAKNREHIEITDVLYKEQLREIIVYYKDSSLSVFRLLLFFRAFLKGIRYVFAQYGKPDLVVSNILTRTAVFACLLKSRYGIDYIISEHWSRYFPENFSYKGYLRKAVTNFVCKRASCIFVPSMRLRDAMTACGIRQHYEIIPNVIETDIFTPGEILCTQENLKKFIHISCFEDKSKNISGLLNAVALLSKKRQDFKLVLAGEGQDKIKMIELADKLNLTQFVEFSGELDTEQLAEKLRSSSFLVLSSHYETFGIVVYEALACGKPVVVTDVADFKTMIDSKYGKLIHVGEIQSLEAAINNMLDNYLNYSPKDLREFVLREFSAEAVSRKFLQVFSKLS